MPTFMPKVRIVFVAPAFPLPTVLMSIPKNDFPTITAVGIEPSKYAIIIPAIIAKLIISAILKIAVAESSS